MKIKNILIEDKIKEKILYKHGAKAQDIKETLSSNPLVLKTKQSRYIAIGRSNQDYLTIIFELADQTAFIITAYPSSEAQRKLYKQRKN